MELSAAQELEENEIKRAGEEARAGEWIRSSTTGVGAQVE